MKPIHIILLSVVLFAILLVQSAFIVDETEQAVVTQFGKPVREPIQTPGLKFKVPFIQDKRIFPKNIRPWDGDPEIIPTLDKTFIWVDAFARWRISNPLTYYENLQGSEINAQARIDATVNAAVRNVISSYSLIESVRSTNRQMSVSLEGIGNDSLKNSENQILTGRAGIVKQIVDQARPKLADLGIEIIDVKFKRVNYVNEVLEKVYERMIAERKQIAEKFRSEGRGASQQILGQTERELKSIYSVAERKAQEIRGDADATATKIYAAAYGRDPEFYTFVKSLDMYVASLDSTTTAILTTDSDFLKYLKSYQVQ